MSNRTTASSSYVQATFTDQNHWHAKSKRTAAQMSFDIGIAEGGARTHDLEVDLFAVIRATRSTN
jgi:hypothetical protein